MTFLMYRFDLFNFSSNGTWIYPEDILKVLWRDISIQKLKRVINENFKFWWVDILAPWKVSPSKNITNMIACPILMLNPFLQKKMTEIWPYHVQREKSQNLKKIYLPLTIEISWQIFIRFGGKFSLNCHPRSPFTVF